MDFQEFLASIHIENSRHAEMHMHRKEDGTKRRLKVDAWIETVEISGYAKQVECCFIVRQEAFCNS